MIGKKPKKNLKKQNVKDKLEHHSIVCECQLQAADLQFARKNWGGAVIRYSQCIDEVVDQLDDYRAEEKSGRFWIVLDKIFNPILNAGYLNNMEAKPHWMVSQMKLRRILLNAYSNRAEARLRIEDYQNALLDSNKALEIYPHLEDYQIAMLLSEEHLEKYPHVKDYLNALLDYDRALKFPHPVDNLIRKGKAAHCLHLFDQACKAFEEADQFMPNNQSISENLQASVEAFTRSKYDLSEFFLKGSKGEVPSCADFVGPVEVRHYVEIRELYAARNVKAGELLIVSNPLAVVVKDVNWEKNLIAEVTDRIRTSKRKMVQLYSLNMEEDRDRAVGFHKEVLGGCSLLTHLFRPESEEFPSHAANDLQVDVDLICRLVREEALCRDNHTLWAKTYGQNENESVGLWVLPRFARHSCAPNVFLTWVGDALFLRASKDLKKNDVLTVSFLQEKHLFLGSVFRSAEIFWSLSFEDWMQWSCRCDRCSLEKDLQAPVATLARIRKVISKLVATVKAEGLEDWKVWHATHELAKVAEEVEREVIQSNDGLGPQQCGWIRSYFLETYIANLQLAINDSDSLCRIKFLSSILDSITSVYITPRALKLAANLLWEVRRMYSKDHDNYVLTLNRVLSIYRVAFGNEPDSVLHKLIKVNRSMDLKDFLLDYKAG